MRPCTSVRKKRRRATCRAGGLLNWPPISLDRTPHQLARRRARRIHAGIENPIGIKVAPVHREASDAGWRRSIRRASRGAWTLIHRCGARRIADELRR